MIRGHINLLLLLALVMLVGLTTLTTIIATTAPAESPPFIHGGESSSFPGATNNTSTVPGEGASATGYGVNGNGSISPDTWYDNTTASATYDESYRLHNNHGRLAYANGTPVQLVGTNLGYGGDVWSDIVNWGVESNQTYYDAMTDLRGRGVNAIRVQIAPFYYRYNTYVDPKNPHNMPASLYYTNNSIDGVTVAQHWNSYDSALDSVVDSAAKHGMYIILDTHASGAPESYDPILNGTGLKYSMASGYAPNQSNLVWLWKRLAPRYANNPFVIYEPYNEVWPVDGGSWSKFQPYDQTMVNTIRQAGASKTLLLMAMTNGGANTAFNTGTNPITLPLNDNLAANPLDSNNIAYSIHEYNTSDVAEYGYGNWDSNLPLVNHYPIFLGEWGAGGSGSGDMGGTDANYVQPLMNWSINYNVAPFIWSYISFFDRNANPSNSWYAGGSLPYKYADSYMVKYNMPFVSAANYTNSIPTSSFTLDRTSMSAPGAVHAVQHASGRPVTWTWNWGDNTSTNVKIGNLDSNGRAALAWNYADHTYNRNGIFPVTLTVSNNKGSTTSGITYVNVGNVPTPSPTSTPAPTAKPSPTPAVVPSPTPISTPKLTPTPSPTSTPVPTAVPGPGLSVVWSGSNFSSWSVSEADITNGVFSDSTTGGPHIAIYPLSMSDNTTYVLRANMSALNGNLVALGRGKGGDDYPSRYAIFDLANGTVARQPSGDHSYAMIKSLGGGVYQCDYVVTNANGSPSLNIASAYAYNGVATDEVTRAGMGNQRFKLYNAAILSGPLSAAPTPTPRPTVVPSPTPKLIPTATSTPTPTVVPSPTLAPTPKPTSTPAPTVMPTAVPGPGLSVVWSGSNFSSWSVSEADIVNVFSDSTTGGPHIAIYPLSMSDNTTYVLRANMSALNGNLVALGRGKGGDDYPSRYAIFDLANGTVARQPSGSNSYATIKSLGGGVYQCDYVVTNANGSRSLNIASAYAYNGVATDEVTRAGMGNQRFKLYNAAILSGPP